MPNYRPVRRAQLISPFGVGALVDFRGDESLMTAGLDEWPYADEECPEEWMVREERLQARLGVDHFRLPPDFREPGEGVQHTNQHIPFVRFPRWHYCPRRGIMEELPLFGSQMKCPCRSGLDCNAIPENRRPFLIPNRFIAICRKGHIEDFPFMKWIHKGTPLGERHSLRLMPGRSSASLSGIRVECICGKSETMTGIFNPEALSRIGYYCAGDMPWLGHTGNEPGQCGEQLRVVQRGASNVYFPLTTSSIYLPVGSEEETRAINSILEDSRFWGMLTSGLEDGRYIQSARSEAIAIVHGIDPEELLQAAQRKLDRTLVESVTQSGTEEEFRRQEYDALRDGRGGETFDLLVEPRNVLEYGEYLAEVLKAVGLVRKLRETRVLVGFSRVLPVEDPTSADRAPISLANGINWLPAIVVYGEGIFIDFDENRLSAWMIDPHVENRISYLSERYNQSRSERGMSEVRVTPKYVLLHTFAHSLIAQLSFDCGYGSAALRERIYCNTDDLNEPMQGVLIYTASGDSEGTMGGLVRQGEPDRLRDVVSRAIYQAQWCSSDPVCIESAGQGTDNANLAACHGCVLLPETSCETGNRLLDRGLMVGTQDTLGSGFFPQFNP
ncbi:MAG: DUF1998 domain-containing protein [Dehalococcoidia bacterium]|nr:DUF1998 domain-containing protein [Dehalococcoidia bacterium]